MTARESGFDLTIGRALVSRAGDSQEVTIKTPVGEYLIELLDVDSSAALELAYRQERRGSVLDRSTSKPVLIVVAANGSLRLVGPDAKAHTLGIGAGMAMVEGERPRDFKLQSIPAWYRLAPVRPIDAEAALVFSRDLIAEADPATGLPTVNANLQRLTVDRRPEEAALAIQTAIMAGDWEAFVTSGFLNNPRMSIHWRPTLDLARQMLAARPELASQLRDQLSATAADGQILFAMLCGLNADQLQAKGLSRLIDELGADELANRVVAFYELQNVTGRKLGFKPVDSNRASILSWRRELAMNRLQILPLGDIIRERVQP